MGDYTDKTLPESAFDEAAAEAVRAKVEALLDVALALVEGAIKLTEPVLGPWEVVSARCIDWYSDLYGTAGTPEATTDLLRLARNIRSAHMHLEDRYGC